MFLVTSALQLENAFEQYKYKSTKTNRIGILKPKRELTLILAEDADWVSIIDICDIKWN